MANAAARAAGVNLSQYTQYQYVIGPGAPCGWAGLAYVPGTTSWVNGTIQLRVIAHEYGHNLGVHHASSLDCRDTGGHRVALSVNNLCGASEYGDPYDVMGIGMTNHMNNFHKAPARVVRRREHASRSPSPATTRWCRRNSRAGASR